MQADPRARVGTGNRNWPGDPFRERHKFRAESRRFFQSAFQTGTRTVLSTPAEIARDGREASKVCTPSETDVPVFGSHNVTRTKAVVLSGFAIAIRALRFEYRLDSDLRTEVVPSRNWRITVVNAGVMFVGPVHRTALGGQIHRSNTEPR